MSAEGKPTPSKSAITTANASPSKSAIATGTPVTNTAEPSDTDKSTPPTEPSAGKPAPGGKPTPPGKPTPGNKPTPSGKPAPGGKPTTPQGKVAPKNAKTSNAQKPATGTDKPVESVKSKTENADAPPEKPQPPIEESKQKDTAANEELAKSRSMSRFGNLLINDDVVDSWEPGLISQDIIDELCCSQFLYDSDASEESYLSITKSGTQIKKYRKKKRVTGSFLPEEYGGEEDEEVYEEVGPPKRASVPDIDGGISKAKLKLMTIAKLKKVHKKIDAEIQIIETENFIMDRTVKKMEKRELEIEAAMPVFTYQYPWENEKDGRKKTIVKVGCNPNLSSDEDEADGVYVPFVPAEAIDFNDPYFDDMSDHMKEAAAQHLLELGEIAPENFDVMRHTYGKLVKPFSTDMIMDEQSNSDPLSKDGAENPEMKKVEVNAAEAFMNNQGIELGRREVDDEDPEFPGFIAKQARKLPITEKLKYAQKEEESLRQEFFDNETKGIQHENAIQVYIDTYINSVDLIRKLQETFKLILSSGYHEVTGHMKAESIMRFRKLMRYRLHNEETKIAMAYNELKKQKRKVDEQVQNNRELGESIQLIDFEQLQIENTQFQGDLDEEHENLKNLKIITGTCFQQLKEYRAKLTNKEMEYRRNQEDTNVRSLLKQNFERSTEKYTQMSQESKAHNEFLKTRLKIFKAPRTIEYMRQKAMKTGLLDEIALLKKKIGHMEKGLQEARARMNKFKKRVPIRDVGKLNRDWLEEIKKEVKEKGLMTCLDNVNDPMGGSMIDFMNKYKSRKGIKKTEKIIQPLDSEERIDSEGQHKIPFETKAIEKELEKEPSVSHVQSRKSTLVEQGLIPRLSDPTNISQQT